MTEIRILNGLSGDMLERIAGFYISANWIKEGDDVSFLRSAFDGSFLSVGAFDGDKIIGCARVLSDGCSDAYIQDVVVDPEFRGQGIGGMLIEQLVSELQDRGIDWIGLVGEPGTESFYSKLNWSKKQGYTLWRWENQQNFFKDDLNLQKS